MAKTKVVKMDAPPLADEPVAEKKKRTKKILAGLHKLYPDAIRTVLDGGWRIDGRRFLLKRAAEGSPSGA